MKRAYCFDLDGTLLDTEVLWVAATWAFLRGRGHRIGEDKVRHIVYGRSWGDVYLDIVRLFPGLEMPRDEMAILIEPYFHKLRDGGDTRIEGSISLLRRLAAQAPVCIVSGSPRVDVDHAVRFLDLEEVLAFTLAAEDYAPGKPDPICYRTAARLLGVPVDRCVVFEDSEAGILAAKGAGMRCVALTRPNVPDQDVSAADLRLCDLEDFDEAALPPIWETC